MLYSVANRTGSRREINKIKNIRAKVSNKYESSISNISNIDSDSSLSIDSE